jgi:hypothetical protein
LLRTEADARHECAALEAAAAAAGCFNDLFTRRVGMKEAKMSEVDEIKIMIDSRRVRLMREGRRWWWSDVTEEK